MVDLGFDRGDLAEPPLGARLAQILGDRGQQIVFSFVQHPLEGLQLAFAPGQRTGRAGIKRLAKSGRNRVDLQASLARTVIVTPQSLVCLRSPAESGLTAWPSGSMWMECGWFTGMVSPGQAYFVAPPHTPVLRYDRLTTSDGQGDCCRLISIEGTS